MQFFYDNLDKLCPELTYCTNENCLLYHPRCFSGVCINFLNHRCEKQKCPLKHLSLKDIKKALKSSINGIYLINLCPNSSNCLRSEDQCQYLHKEWINKGNICLQHLDDECIEQNCQQKHISWEELQQEVQQQYQQNGLYPEYLCEKQECSINCRGHSQKLKKFCISNFKGTCKSKGKCHRIHIDWEDLKTLKPEHFFHTTLPSCIGLTENKNITVDVKFSQKLNVWFHKKLLKKISKSIEQENIADVIFIMDCTGSMASWIKAIQDNIIIIIEKFKLVIKNYMVRIAFVGFRDFSDGDGHIVIHDFTADVKQIKSFIQKQEATGGGDVAEDVAGALERALTLDFSKHPDSILCTFLFCDAPTHGQQYHNLDSDEYKDKIKKGYLEDIMKRFREIKRNNFFTCCKITNHTKKMFDIMKSNFQGLEIAESSAEKISDQIVFTLIQSYKNSKLNCQKYPYQKEKIRIAATYTRHKALTPIKCKRTGCPDDINYWANFLQQLGLNQVSGQTVLEIDTSPIKIDDPEERGLCSYVFRVFDVRNNRNLIAKLPKCVVDEIKMKEQKIDTELYAKRMVKVRYFQTLIAQQLANGYRRESRKIPNAPPLFYVSPIQYELQETFYGITNLYAETEIDLPGKWQKFSNNANFMNENGQAYGSFSHLTYEWSNSQVMVTDLQGKQGIFSDPAIHTNFLPLDEILQDQTNFNLRGMMQFMEGQHPSCTVLCQSLKLTRQELSISEFDTFIANESFDPIKSGKGAQYKNMKKLIPENIIKVQTLKLEKVNCVCDICGNIFQIDYKTYQNQTEDEFYCNYCTQAIERDDVCECCGDIFKYHHLQALRLGQIPTKCNYCLENCKDNDTKCIYCLKYCEKREIKPVIMGGISYNLCKLGRDHFESLSCLICFESFPYLECPTSEAYKTGSFTCKDCMQKQN